MISKHLPRASVAMALLVSVAACAGDSPTDPAATVLAAEPVSTTGGSVETPGDTVRLSIPAGALSQTTTITVQPSTTHAPSANLVAGTAFDFGPDGTQFAQPVTLAITYDPARLPQGVSEGSLAIYKAVGSGWQLIPGSSVDMASNRVTAPISSFSIYAVLSMGAPSGLTRQEGDAQEGQAGMPVAIAPAVIVRNSAGAALPNVAVTFAVATGGGSITGATATTDASGIARVGSWTLGAVGSNTLTATAAGVAEPVTFTATAIAACDWAPAYVVGTTVTGALAEADCREASGRRADYRTLTVGARTSVTLELTATGFTPLVGITLPDGTPVVTQYTTSPGFTRAVLAPGTYRLLARAVDTLGRGDYSLTLRPDANDLDACGATANVFLSLGATANGTITANNCADSFDPQGGRLDAYGVWMRAGQTYRVELTGTPVAKVSIWGPVVGGTASELKDLQSASGTARVTYTATADAWHTVYALGPVGTAYGVTVTDVGAVDRCAQVANLAIGMMAMGKFNADDCRDASGRPYDRWAFSTTQQFQGTIHVAGDSLQALQNVERNGRIVTTTYVGANGFSRVLLAAGSYQLIAKQADTASRRVYTVNVSAAGHANGCGATFNTFATSGTSTTGQIAVEDCVDRAPMGDTTMHWDSYAVAVDSGAVVSATMTTNGAGSVSIWGPDFAGANQFFRNEWRGDAGPVTVTHTAQRSGYHTFYTLGRPGLTYSVSFQVTGGTTAALRAGGTATLRSRAAMERVAPVRADSGSMR